MNARRRFAGALATQMIEHLRDATLILSEQCGSEFGATELRLEAEALGDIARRQKRRLTQRGDAFITAYHQRLIAGLAAAISAAKPSREELEAHVGSLKFDGEVVF